MPTQPAILNRARLNNFRLNYLPAGLRTIRYAKVGIWIGGVDYRTKTRVGSIQIQNVLNDAPDTASFTVDTTAPTVGMDVKITVNVNAPRTLFHGTVQSVELSYEGRAKLSVWKCTAADDLTRANMKRPFGTWSQISATTVAQQLMTNFAPGFTTQYVQQGLPLVSVTFDGADALGSCLKRLATLIGGYFYIEDLDLHLFQSEFIDVPDPIYPGYPFLADPPIAQATNLSQIRTRNYGKGHGENCLTDILVGETVVPLADAEMFNPNGGQAMSATARDGAQHQKLTYTGTQIGGTGALVGPGVAPTNAPTVTRTAGTGIDAGTHGYAYTWVTASGETTPSPLVATIAGPLIPPTRAPRIWDSPNTGQMVPGGSYQYVYTYSEIGAPAPEDHTRESLPSPPSVAVVTTAGMLNYETYGSTDASVHRIYLYRTAANSAGPFKLQGYFTVNPDGGTYGFFDAKSDATLGVAAPTVGSGGGSRVNISNVALGPGSTTARKVYRTAANASQLKLQQTIANNTATVGVTDSSADAALGANAPGADTSGLSTVTGQVNAGSTSLLTSGTAVFAVTGGWVILSGGQVVRYSAITGNTLTGIPATGPGAIRITVLYGSQVTAAPCLTGVTGVVTAMEGGSPIHLWIQVDDVPAQNDLIAMDAAQGRTSDGIYEYLIQDEQRSEAALTDLCRADLKLFSRPLVTVRYATRDLKTKAGKPIAISLTAPPIVANLTIQDVTITELEIAQGLAPKFTVSASSVRWSLEDLLRQLAVAAGGNG